MLPMLRFAALQSEAVRAFPLALVCVAVVFLASCCASIEEECADEEYSYTEPDEPDVSVQGIEIFQGVCLTKNDDRFHIVAPRREGGAVAASEQSSSVHSSIYMLATDLCAMGHTTKDPAHFLSFLLDHFALSEQNASIQLHVIYGNVCMARPGGPGGNKRTKVFHSVLLGWFRAIFRIGSPLHRALLAMGAVLHEGDSILAESGKVVPLFVREHFFHHMPSPRFCGTSTTTAAGIEMPPYLTIVKRQERWRWFRTRRHAAVFRACLLEHYGIMPKNVTSSKGDEQLAKYRSSRAASSPAVASHEDDSTTSGSHMASNSSTVAIEALGYLHPFHLVILRRDEDRHFSEEAVNRLVSSMLPRAAVRVHLVTFDNIRGSKGKAPPSFEQQLEYLSQADIFIAAHGAGLSSIIAMRPGGVVVELFPSNFRYYMYQELAQLLSLKYMAIESDRVWPVGCCRGSKQPLLELDFPSHMNGVGARACKKCDIRLTLGQLHRVLIEAIGHVSLGRPWHALGVGAPFFLD